MPHTKDDGERHTRLWRERNDLMEVGESQQVNIVVGLVSTTKGWDIDGQ